MAFREKINTLLTVFRMNNVTLARGIGVDPSLVSRWRNGDRVPAKPERAARDIAAFLSGAQALPLDLKQLEGITGRHCGSAEETEDSVYKWLLEPESKPVQRFPPPRASELVRVFSGFLSGDSPVPSGPLNLWPHVQKGIPSEHEVFFGNRGRRQAAVNFMHAVQSVSKPGDVYLSGWADASWLEDREEFAELWLRCMQMILQNGHRLHLLSPPILSPVALSSLLRLPLHHLGSCVMYTAPAQDSTIMMVGKGMGAVISYPDTRETTLFFRTLNDSLFFDSMVSRIFESGSPLLTTCGKPREVAERSLLLENGEGNFFSAGGSLGVHNIPADIIYAALEKNLPADEAGRMAELFKKRKEARESSLRRYAWVELLPGSVLDAISLNGSCRIGGSQLALGQDVTLSGASLKRTLDNILDRLRNSHRFHIAVSDEELSGLSILYREGAGALFCPEKPRDALCAAYMGPSPLLEGLSKWFSDKALEKSAAIRRVEAALEGI